MTASSIGTAFVVGSGPTGLASAIALRTQGFDVRIIDRSLEPSTHSKALVVWARTLELLDDHLDVDRLIDSGIPGRTMRLFASGRKVAEIGLEETDSRFVGGLFLPQYDLERILAERVLELGVTLERGLELIGFEQTTDHTVDVTLRDSKGAQITASADWLIDCSGSHGVVRRHLDLGDRHRAELPVRFSIADVVVSGAAHEMPAPSEGIASNFTHPEGLCVFFPVDDARYRIVLEDDSIDEGAVPDLTELARAVRQRTGLELELSDPAWLTSFGVRERVLADYGVGRVLIAGDAAHVHSPAGGHGMNTGIQDAINLAWKIALVSRGVAGHTTLRSYSEERSEIGRQIVMSSDHMTRLMTLRNPVMRFARDAAINVALGFDPVQRKALRSLSMLDLNYRNVGLRSSSSIRRDRDSLHPGDRLPPIALQSSGDRIHVDELTRPDRFTLFVLESPATPDFDRALEEMGSLLERLPDALRPLVQLVPIHADEARGEVCDVSGDLRARAGFRGHGAMLVRPDRHVAFFCGALDGQPVLDWFAGL